MSLAGNRLAKMQQATRHPAIENHHKLQNHFSRQQERNPNLTGGVDDLGVRYKLVAKATPSPWRPLWSTPAALYLSYSIVLARKKPHPLLFHVCKQRIQCLRPLFRQLCSSLTERFLLRLWRLYMKYKQCENIDQHEIPRRYPIALGINKSITNKRTR